jgi:hypothetical protein
MSSKRPADQRRVAGAIAAVEEVFLDQFLPVIAVSDEFILEEINVGSLISEIQQIRPMLLSSP